MYRHSVTRCSVQYSEHSFLIHDKISSDQSDMNHFLSFFNCLLVFKSKKKKKYDPKKMIQYMI